MDNKELKQIVDECIEATSMHLTVVQHEAVLNDGDKVLQDVAEGLSITYSKLLTIGQELKLRGRRKAGQ